MRNIPFNLWQIFLYQEGSDIFRQAECVSQDGNDGVDLVRWELEGEQGGDEPSEGHHVVRSVQVWGDNY